MKATEILQEEDLAWLIRFKETAEDDNSYDTPKAALKRLMELGVVRSLGFGRCATTAFGDWLVEQHFEQAPTLPLKTEDDYSKTPNAKVSGAGTASAGLPGYASAETTEKRHGPPD